MKNIQISFDEDLINEVDRFAASSKTTRSAVIRDATKRWMRDKEIKKFEESWIKSMKENPDDSRDAEVWIQAQHWSKK